MKHLRLILLACFWFLILLTACGEIAPAPTATPVPPTLTKIKNTPVSVPSPVTTRPANVSPASTPAPTPTPLVTPAIDNRVSLAIPSTPFPAATGVPAKPNLTEHESAMLPAFKNDVKLAQDLAAPVYNIVVRLAPDTDNPEAAGHEQVIYTNDTGGTLDSVYFWLWANEVPLASGDLPVAISNVRVNGQAANWSLENNRSMIRVYFDPARPLAAGSLAAIEMDFRLKVSNEATSPFFRYSPEEQIFHLCYWYPQVALYDKSFGGWDVHNFSPDGDVTNSRTSFFKVWLITPDDQTVVANGRMAESKLNSDGTKTTKFITGPVRDFVAALSAQYQIATQPAGDTRVTAYFLEKDRIWGEKMLKYAVDSLKTYSDAFGTYPYAEYNMVEVVLTNFGGLEFPGMVYITTRYFNPDAVQSLEYVVAHETGHQWWYGLVGSDQIRHPFQDESLTQYVPVLYFERFKSKAEAQGILQTYMKSGFQAAVAAKHDDIVDQPVSAFNQPGDYVAMVYNKGGLLYDAYRQKFGDAAFLKFARIYLQNNRYKFASPDDILDALKAGAGSGQANAVAELYRHWINAKEGGGS